MNSEYAYAILSFYISGCNPIAPLRHCELFSSSANFNNPFLLGLDTFEYWLDYYGFGSLVGNKIRENIGLMEIKHYQYVFIFW